MIGSSSNVGVNSGGTSNNMGSTGSNTIVLDMKKDRSSKSKDKRDKQTDEEKELRKERKLGRKRVKYNVRHQINLFMILFFFLGSNRRDFIGWSKTQKRGRKRFNFINFLISFFF